MARKKSKKVDIKTKKTDRKMIERPTRPSAWNPFDVFETFDRWLWEDPWRPGWPLYGRPLSNWTGGWLERDTKITPLDLVDTGNEFKIIADMPGISKKNLDVNITPNAISICGETKIESKEEEKGYLRHERSYSTICRNLTFPEEVNPEKAEATLKDGILEVVVSKKTPSKTKGRKISIK